MYFLQRKAAAEEAEKEEDRARMESVTRSELVDTRVEEELERQARCVKVGWVRGWFSFICVKG